MDNVMLYVDFEDEDDNVFNVIMMIISLWMVTYRWKILMMSKMQQFHIKFVKKLEGKNQKHYLKVGIIITGLETRLCWSIMGSLLLLE